jgi:hypothetical protein
MNALACGDSGSEPSPGDATNGSSPSPPGDDPTAALSVAPIAWGSCPASVQVDQCATVKVPLDYTQPSDSAPSSA